MAVPKRRRSNKATIRFAFLLLIMELAILYVSIGKWNQQRQTANWIPTGGRLDFVELRHRYRSGSYSIVEYSYAVEGRILEGSMLRYGATTDTNYYAIKHVAGESITVYFCPDDPRRSVLFKGMTSEDYGGIILAAIGFLFTIGALLSLPRKSSSFSKKFDPSQDFLLRIYKRSVNTMLFILILGECGFLLLQRIDGTEIHAWLYLLFAGAGVFCLLVTSRSVFLQGTNVILSRYGSNEREIPVKSLSAIIYLKNGIKLEVAGTDEKFELDPWDFENQAEEDAFLLSLRELGVPDR